MAHDAGLESTITALAALDRPPASDGEREAAEWIAERLSELGCDVRIEAEPAHGSYAWPLALLSAAGALTGLAALSGRRIVAIAGGALVAAAMADDVTGGPHVVRRFLRRRTTHNVVAETGDRRSQRTLVVLAHHDAAQSGLIFNQSAQKRVWERFPALIDNTDTSIPLWWPVIAAPALISVGAALRRRRLIGVGLVISLGSVATFIDIARRPAVPGANDNLTAVAGLVALAGRLRERPVEGLRIMLVSCGAEEALQEGIRGFARRHFAFLPIGSTSFLNLETVGSPQLALLEGEGPLKMRDYPGGLRDLVADAAGAAGVPLRRGLRSRNSTDSAVPSRAGYPVATLISINAWKALSNYHWPSDTPENVDYDTLAAAVDVAEATIRALAAS
jgi:hypothetical protein